MPKKIMYRLRMELTIPPGEDPQKFKKRVKRKILDGAWLSDVNISGNKVIATRDLKGKGHGRIAKLRNAIRKHIKDVGGVLYYEIDSFAYKTMGSASYMGYKVHIPKLANGTINYQWNHDCVNFPKAIEKISKPNTVGLGELNQDLGHKATGIRVFQFDTGYSNHEAIHSYPGYLSQDKPEGKDLSLSFVHDEKMIARDDLSDYFLATSAYQKPAHATATAFTMIGQGKRDEHAWRFYPPALQGREKSIRSIRTVNYGKGLFPYVEFVPVRISATVSLGGDGARDLMPNVGDADRLIVAVDHAIKNKADVITMSMGGSLFGEQKETIKDRFKAAYSNGIIIVCAAGNGEITDAIFDVVTPAKYGSTIAVAAVEPYFDNHDKQLAIIPWDESCDGEEVDISAPGKYIYTCFKLDPDKIQPDDKFIYPQLQKGDLYKFGGATSQATVHVASAAALWRFYYNDKLKSDPFYYDAANKQFNAKVVEAFRYALQKSKNTFRGEYGDWNEVDSGPMSKHNHHRRDKRDKNLEDGKVENKKTWLSDYKGVLDVYSMIDEAYAPDTPSCKAFAEKAVRSQGF
ncbi:MAG: S8 family serine peptidase [Crocinitomicaceae bacterium]|nr:S8 family serine peptidase [Crocinitomicaceae bacterium]